MHLIDEKTKAQENCGLLFKTANRLYNREKTTVCLLGQENPNVRTVYKRYIFFSILNIYLCAVWVETFSRSKWVSFFSSETRLPVWLLIGRAPTCLAVPPFTVTEGQTMRGKEATGVGMWKGTYRFQRI